MCVFVKEINKKKKIFFYLVRSFLYGYCPLVKGDKIIPLYTSFNLNYEMNDLETSGKYDC